MAKELILIGGFHEIIELCELANFKIIGIIDNRLKNRFMGYDVLGNDRMAPTLFKEYGNVPLIVVPDRPQRRMKLTLFYSRIGFHFANLISPRAAISSSAKIGKGVVIQSGVNVSSSVSIGNHVKLNSCSNVMHDSIIHDFVTIAPNAVVLGRVRIRELAYIGSNATILPDIVIGKNAVVGAGAAVIKNVGENDRVISSAAKNMEGGEK